MALTYPLSWPQPPLVERVTFDISRVDAVSRTRGGAVQGVERGRSLWRFEAVTTTLNEGEFEAFRAFLSALRGPLKPFLFYDVGRRRPRAYPTGALPLASVTAASGHAISLSGLTPGYTVRAGDYLSWAWGNSRTLRRAVEDATANGSGVLTGLTVEPDVPAGGTLPQVVALEAAPAVFRLVETPAMRRRLNYGEPMTISGIQVLA